MYIHVTMALAQYLASPLDWETSIFVLLLHDTDFHMHCILLLTLEDLEILHKKNICKGRSSVMAVI